MGLAHALDRDESAVRADLQRYYGIDLDHAMAGEHSAGHVAALMAHLPSDSSVRRSESPDAAWSLEASMLALLYNLLTAVIYGLGGKKGKLPEQVGPSWMKPEPKAPARAMTIDELMEQLAKPRS
jgi:hypothetical protein